MRRVAGLLAVIAGLGLMVVPLVLSLFSRSADAEQVTDRFRPLMSEAGLQRMRGAFDTVEPGTAELVDDVLPGLAEELRLSEPAFDELLSEESPKLADLAEQSPAFLDFVGGVVSRLEVLGESFRNADAIPTEDVPITAGPWFFLGAGALLVVLGGIGFRAGSRVAMLLIVALGVVMVIGPLATHLPEKAADGSDVAEVSRVGLSPEVAGQAVDFTILVDDAVEEARDDLIPNLARRLGTTTAEFEDLVQERYPDFFRFVEEWEDISPRAHDLADAQVETGDDFANADRIPFRSLTWFFVVPGLAVAILAAAASGSPGHPARSAGHESTP